MTREADLARLEEATTPGGELERLVRKYPYDGAMLGAAVRHPNLPLRCFVELASRYPLEACDNPALELYTLEEPGWPSRVLDQAMFAMVLTGGHMVGLVGLTGELGRRARAAGQLAPRDIAERVLRMTPTVWEAHFGLQIAERAAQEPSVRGIAVEILRLHEVARADWLPRAWVRVLAEHPSWAIRVEVARRDDLEHELAVRLAADDAAIVRQRIATRTDLSPSLALQLAADPEPGVRRTIALNRGVSDVIAERMLADPAQAVVQAARMRSSQEDAPPR